MLFLRNPHCRDGRTNGEVCYSPLVEKPDKIVLSKEELSQLQRKLQTMSLTGLYDYYRAAYHRCRLEGYAIPPARAIQELVQAWKAIRKG